MELTKKYIHIQNVIKMYDESGYDGLVTYFDGIQRVFFDSAGFQIYKAVKLEDKEEVDKLISRVKQTLNRK
jgi:hypothetical protein